MQIWLWEKEITARLADVDSPALSARLLLRHVTGLSEIDYLLAMRDELSNEHFRKLAPLVARRANGEPMAYILGHKEFYCHNFIVSPAVLIPRPETEMLVDLALERTSLQKANFVDAGCGSGCIGLSIALAKPAWQGYLLDIGADALKIANANRNALGASATIFQADMARLPFADDSIDLLLSNPPYIDCAYPERVMVEVLAYEPHSALFSPTGGLAHIKALAREATRVLRRKGIFIVEHGFDQGSACREIFQAAGMTEVEIIPDLAGLPRCAFGIKA